MSDLVDELRKIADRPDAGYPATMLDAAARIEQLEKAIERAAVYFESLNKQAYAVIIRAALDYRQMEGEVMTQELRERVIAAIKAKGPHAKPSTLADAAIRALGVSVKEGK